MGTEAEGEGERGWAIRDYQRGDEAAIVDLHSRVFAEPSGARPAHDPRPACGPLHWRWEFADNPVGPQTIKLVWREPSSGDPHSDLVGQYAVSPRRLRCLGETRLAGLSIDAMTDPAFKRQGIFSASAEACYTTMRERDFCVVFGFPNADSIRGFEKNLGWRSVMPLPVLIKPLDLGELLGSQVERPQLRSLLSIATRQLSRAPGIVDELSTQLQRAGPRPPVRTFDRFGDWVDPLWRRCQSQHEIWVIRDQEYLEWRYDQRPGSDYLRLRVDGAEGISGYAVLAFSTGAQGPGAFIMELVVDLEQDGALRALLRSIEEQARARSCAFLSAMSGPGSRYRSALLRQAYLPLPERLFPRELYFGARPLDTLEGMDAAMLMHPTSWELSWGDTDLV